MAKSVEDLEVFLERLGRRYERLDDGTLLVSFGADRPPGALRVAPPVAVAQVEIGPCPAADQASSAALYRRLLELNAQGLVHAAYAIEAAVGGDRIVLTAALELEHLDSNELEALLADIDIALSEHVPELRRLAPAVDPLGPQKGAP